MSLVTPIKITAPGVPMTFEEYSRKGEELRLRGRRYGVLAT
jgi:hypothetical protein